MNTVSRIAQHLKLFHKILCGTFPFQPMPTKSPLAMMLAIAPKSRNPEGKTGSSTASPDQGGDVMVEEESVEVEAPENSIPIPPGFKIPEGSDGGGLFTTTVEVRQDGDRLVFEKVGGMSLGGAVEEAGEVEEEVEEPDPMTDTGEDVESPALSDYDRKKKESMSAKKAFQGGY